MEFSSLENIYPPIDQAPQIIESENTAFETIVIDTAEGCKKSVKVG
ncbi:MAG: hypothetical protein ACSHX0_01320 [Akkermansiaceae bacterium]